MSFLDRFFRQQKKEKLEKQAEKQQKEISKDLELTKKIKDQESKKKEVKKIPIVKTETKKKETVKIGAKGTKPKFNVDVPSILIKPLITEKISSMAVFRKYAFKVASNANKVMVKKAVSTLYGVNVRDVRIVNMRGKRVRYGRQWGKKQDWKKAIVSLAPGEKIEIYEGV